MITIKLKLSRIFAFNNKIIVYGACFHYREIDYCSQSVNVVITV